MKQKWLLVLPVLCIMLIMVPVYALAAGETTGSCGEGVSWSYDNTSKILTISGDGEIQGYKTNNEGGYSGEYCIPLSLRQEVEQVKFAGNFTSIGVDAFSGFSNLTDILIPTGITDIYSEAFAGCTALTEAVIPEGVTRIDETAFRGCTSLAHIEVPSSFTVCYNNVGFQRDTGMFYKISSPLLTSAGPKGSGKTIEFGWTNTIPAGAFRNLRSLTEITLPNGVQTIGDDAFAGTGLTELTIPASVTRLGRNVFGGCDDLFRVVIYADSSALSDGYSGSYHSLYDGMQDDPDTASCPFLTSVGPIGSNSSIQIGWTSISPYAFSGCVGLRTVTIPETVTTIGEGAFNSCEGLTQITIPNTVTTIGSRAISYCTQLQELRFPASVLRINNGHDGMFGGCTSLATITVDSGNKVYASQDGALFSKEKAILYCVPTGKTSFSIPAGVNEIAERAFYGCENLTEVTIPSSVTTISYDAFFDCSGLTRLVIPSSVTSDRYDFRLCAALVDLTLPGAGALGTVRGPSLTTIRITEGTESLNGTFSDLSTLTTVYLPASLKRIESDTFANCSNLKTVYFAGTKAQWNALAIASGNQELSSAKIICAGAASAPILSVPNDPDQLKTLASQLGLLRLVNFDRLDDAPLTRLEIAELTAAMPGITVDTSKVDIPFTDCDALTNLQKAAISAVVDRGILGGASSDRFLPQSQITRAQAATIIWRALDGPEPNTSPDFSDVAVSAWFERPLASLTEIGIIETASAFYPNALATRHDVLRWMCAASLYAGGGEIPDIPALPDPGAPDELLLEVSSGGLGRKITVQINGGHWLTVQVRRAGSISISSIRVPGEGRTSMYFSAPTGSVVQVWETEREMSFTNGVPSNTILATAVRTL